MSYLVAVHCVSVLQGHGLADGDADGVRYDDDSEGVGEHQDEQVAVRNPRSLQPGGSERQEESVSADT